MARRLRTIEYEAYCYLRDYGAHLSYLSHDEKLRHSATSPTREGAMQMLLRSKYVKRFIRNNKQVPRVYVRVWRADKAAKTSVQHIITDKAARLGMVPR